MEDASIPSIDYDADFVNWAAKSTAGLYVVDSLKRLDGFEILKKPSSKRLNAASSKKLLVGSSRKLDNTTSQRRLKQIDSTGLGRDGVQRCIRKGDKIYYNNQENIHKISSRSEEMILSQNKQENGSFEKSLPKVFDFEQTSNQEDLDKCIRFWKNVMEKNLVPIKTTIINENSIFNEMKHSESKQVVSTASSKPNKTLLPDAFKYMWTSAVKDMQRKKLHEVKLMEKTHCKMCESVSSMIEDDICKRDKNLFEKGIVNLNKWKPTSKKKPGSLLGKKVSKLSSSSSIKSSASTDILPPTFPPPDIPPPALPKYKPADLQPDTNTYEHIDVIKEKKENGGYGKWRSNQVTCSCGNPDCICDTDPNVIALKTTSAVTNVNQKSELAFASNLCWQKFPEVDTCIEPIPKSASVPDTITVVPNPTVAVKLSELETPVDRLTSISLGVDLSTGKGLSISESRHRSIKQALSVVMHCPCGENNCDCGWIVEKLEHEKLPSDTIIPMPVRRGGFRRTKLISSLELLHKKISHVMHENPDIEPNYADDTQDDEDFVSNYTVDYDNIENGGKDNADDAKDDDDNEKNYISDYQRPPSYKRSRDERMTSIYSAPIVEESTHSIYSLVYERDLTANQQRRSILKNPFGQFRAKGFSTSNSAL